MLADYLSSQPQGHPRDGMGLRARLPELVLHELVAGYGPVCRSGAEWPDWQIAPWHVYVMFVRNDVEAHLLAL
jgi:hypothetical protein